MEHNRGKGGGSHFMRIRVNREEGFENKQKLFENTIAIIK